jgi:hypothetical protein
MGTVTVTTSGFAALPSATPTNWPSYVTYPGAAALNGTRTVNINDADWVKLVTWIAASQFSGTPTTPATPTAAQLLLAWPQNWLQGTIIAIQQYHTTPPVVPPPITIA